MEKQTPLYKAVMQYIGHDASRFHMPGHKGMYLRKISESVPFMEAYRFDITEVKGADSLYTASGAIAETERAFAKLYGAHTTLLSAGGATLCLQTMLAIVAKEGGKVIAGRNLHTSAVSAMGLLGLTPVWVFSDGGAGCAVGGRTQAADIAAALKANPGVCAVYVTSPDYFGLISDIKAIAEVCEPYGVPLLVDNAHGAHLKFMPQSLHPMDLGADMCCDSLHKTMPVLTGGALLHIKNAAYAECAKEKMSLFGSTSPSYLIMLSCDVCLGYIEKGAAAEEFAVVRDRVKSLEELAAKKGFVRLTGVRDYTKLVLSVYNWGVDADLFAERLREYGIEPEFVSNTWAVLMASPENLGGDYRRVEKFINAWDIEPRSVQPKSWSRELPECVLSLREALFARGKAVSVGDCVGEISAVTVCECPPGVPVVMPGEQITPQAAELLKISGKEDIKVVL